jgi:uncharacterized protein YlzI (FlbEa/FlbD family)
MLNHGKNCLVVKHKNDWYKHMVKLIENPAMIEDLKSKVKAIITMNLLGIKISDSDKEVLAKITDYDKSIGSTYNPEDKKNI